LSKSRKEKKEKKERERNILGKEDQYLILVQLVPLKYQLSINHQDKKLHQLKNQKILVLKKGEKVRKEKKIE